MVQSSFGGIQYVLIQVLSYRIFFRLVRACDVLSDSVRSKEIRHTGSSKLPRVVGMRQGLETIVIIFI